MIYASEEERRKKLQEVEEFRRGLELRQTVAELIATILFLIAAALTWRWWHP